MFPSQPEPPQKGLTGRVRRSCEFVKACVTSPQGCSVPSAVPPSFSLSCTPCTACERELCNEQRQGPPAESLYSET